MAYTNYNYMDREDQGAMSPEQAATPAAMGLSNPAAAAIGVGGSFLQQYLAQKAKQEADKKAAAMSANQQYTQDQVNILNSLMNSYKGALR